MNKIKCAFKGCAKECCEKGVEKEILNYAEKNDIGLIVTGTKGLLIFLGCIFFH